MHPLAFQLLTCVSLAAFGNDTLSTIATGLFTGIGHDVLKKIPGPRLRPQGEPNHDLQTALAEAIADAASDLDLDSIIRAETDSLRDLEGGAHLHIEEFLLLLEKSPAKALNIEAENTDLKAFLEDPSSDTFAPLAHILGEQHLPGLSPEVRDTVIRKLFLRISERYWDRIKRTPAAWNGYSAEVFREFRKTLAEQSDTQREILGKLDLIGKLDRLIIQPPPLSSEPIAENAIDSLRADLNADIAGLSRKMDLLQSTADRTLHKAGEIHDEGRKLSFLILAALAAILIVAAGGILAYTSTRKSVDSLPGKLLNNNEPTREEAREVLRKEIEQIAAAKIAKLDPVEDWQRISDIETDRDINLAGIDRSLDQIDSTIAAGEASAIYLTASDILKNKGSSEALEYLESKAATRERRIALASALRDRDEKDLRKLLREKLLTATAHLQLSEYEQAEAIYREVIAKDTSWPEARHEYFVYLIWTKGARQQTYGTLAAAEATYREAMDQATLLTLQDKGNTQWQRNLSVSHDKLGDIAVAQGDLAAARTSYTAALRIVESLVARDPENTEWQSDLFTCYNNLGNLASMEGDLPAAWACSRMAHMVSEALVKQDPENTEWQRDLSISHNKLGDLAVAQGDLPAARASYTAGLEIAETLAARDEGNTQWQRDLSISHDNLGDIAVAEGDLAAARAAYSAALKIRETLAARDGENTQWQRDLSISHDRLGNIAVAQGDLPAARASHAAALEIRETLAARDPENTEWQRDVAVSYIKLATLAEKEGDEAEARKQWLACIAIFEELIAAGKHVSPSDRKWVADLKADLGIE